METSVQMIVDKLIHYDLDLHLANSSAALKNVKLVLNDQFIFRSNYVYLVHAKDLKEKVVDYDRLNFVCLGNDACLEKKPGYTSCNIITILDSELDIISIFNEIQDIFDDNEEWENALQESVMLGRGLQDLVNISYRVFCNPIFLVDSALMTLAWSKEVPADAIDHIWSSIVSEGHANIEFINSMKGTEEQSYLDNLITPTFVSLSSVPYRAININVKKKSKTLAILIVLEIQTKLQESHLHLAKHLARYVSLTIQRDLRFLKTRGTTYDNIIIDLLEGKKQDIDCIKSYLQHLNWKIDDQYALFKVQVSESDITDNTLMYYGNLLRMIFIGNYTVIYKNSVVMIINWSKFTTLNQVFISSLLGFLEKNNLKGGLSSDFTNFTELHDHYLEASASILLGNRINAWEQLYFYRDYLFYHIIEKCSKHINLPNLCHPALTKLLEYDRKFHTDYVHSFYVYLMKNRNLVESAEALNIHRNTFVYRIDKIEKIIASDFTNENDLLHILFSYKLINYLGSTE